MIVWSRIPTLWHAFVSFHHKLFMLLVLLCLTLCRSCALHVCFVPLGVGFSGFSGYLFFRLLKIVNSRRFLEHIAEFGSLLHWLD